MQSPLKSKNKIHLSGNTGCCKWNHPPAPSMRNTHQVWVFCIFSNLPYCLDIGCETGPLSLRGVYGAICTAPKKGDVGGRANNRKIEKYKKWGYYILLWPLSLKIATSSHCEVTEMPAHCCIPSCNTFQFASISFAILYLLFFCAGFQEVTSHYWGFDSRTEESLSLLMLAFSWANLGMLQHHQLSCELPQTHRCPLELWASWWGWCEALEQSKASICMPKKAVLEGRSWSDNNCGKANGRQRRISEWGKVE